MTKNESDIDLETALKQAERAAYCNFAAPWCVYTRLYSHSTEITEDYLVEFNLKNKRILTVGSSGDQVLTYALLGSKDITLMDANILTPFFLGLKIAAIKTLELEEFLSFFQQDNNADFMSLKLYGKIRPLLDEKNKIFWDKLYDDGIYNKLFHFESSADTKSKPPYLANRANYEKLKSIIDEVDIKFFASELSDFSTNAEGEYYLVDLSNIYTYVPNEHYWKAVDGLYHYLSKDGILKLHYGNSDKLKEFTFLEKESSTLPVKNIENRCFIIWQNDEYLYKRNVEKKH